MPVTILSPGAQGRDEPRSAPTPSKSEFGEPILEIRDLVKRYGTHMALAGVSLSLRQGEIFALLGPNGAGKSTLIGAVCGQVKKTSGTVKLFGVDLDQDPIAPRYEVGLVPQEVNYDPYFTVGKTLRLQLGLYARPRDAARVQEVAAAVGLGKKVRALNRDLSGGMKRRLLIAKALVPRPKLVFLDEPTAGVDVELRRDLWRYVRQLKAEGTTIVLTTHYLEEAEELADRVGVINEGRLLLVEEKDALMKRLGERRLLVSFGAAVPALPEPVARAGAVLAEEGRALTYVERPGTTCNEVLDALYRAGLPVQDVETRRSRLEDVLLGILRGPEVPPDTATPERAEAPPPVRDPAPEPRPVALEARGAFNTLGTKTLLAREVERFFRGAIMSLASPFLSVGMYFIIFGSMGSRSTWAHGVPYLLFIVPGLVFLSIANNAFNNSSSGLYLQRVQGLVDLLAAPLGPLELMIGYLGAAMMRGLLMGLVTWGVTAAFVGLHTAHPLATAAYFLVSAYVFSLLGLLVGIWAEKSEQMNFFPAFVMMPLTFLGGVFYSVRDLPSPWQAISMCNPIVYMVEGLRYGMLGESAMSPLLGAALLLGLAAVATAVVVWALRTGFRMKT